jgi:flagellar motor switch protein FliG
MPTNNEAIRKAAILISALEMDAADALLEQMPEDFATAVRDCVMELDHIDADEEQSVIGQFLGRELAPSTAPSDLIELDDASAPISLEDYLTRNSCESGSNECAANDGFENTDTPETLRERATTVPFDFLQTAGGDELYSALRNEHPQVVALVLSHVSAEQAAGLLHRLPASKQVDVARRMVELEDVDSETILELEAGLRGLIGLSSQISSTRTGLTAMQNIVAYADGAGNSLFDNLQRVDAALAKQLRTAQRKELPTTKPAAQTIALRKRQTVCLVAFDDLLTLSDADLGKVLQQAEGKVLLLALAGASAELIAKIYRQLPRSDADTLRRQIEQQGPIRLRDVEAAQQRIGRIAGELADTGEIELPISRRFAMAA